MEKKEVREVGLGQKASREIKLIEGRVAGRRGRGCVQKEIV